MAKIYAIYSTSALYRPMMNSKGYCIALAKRDYLRPGLYAGPLFRKHKLPSCEVSLRLGQQDCNLYRKDMLSIQVLVKAVVVSRAILKKQRCGPLLACVVTSSDEVGMILWVLDLDSQSLVPTICDRGQ